MVRFESLARFPILCIVTLALSYIITEIKRDIGRQLQFFSYPLHSTPPLRGRSIADFAVPFINIVYYCDLIVIVKPPLATAKAASCNGPVHLFVSLSVRLSVCRQNTITRFSQKLSNLELWCLLTTYTKSYVGFSKNPLLDPKIQDGADPPSLKST